ncbi:4'-phosphopantetheinyl transferase superfamily protein [Kitasatospora sp. NPDC096077]|uniref:4'-phosphopantetheinyl transferase family protein n=1 Tax=Kitasatospora sp. NPDC096077 TaxID=3155544 RepID=UPI00331CDE7A
MTTSTVGTLLPADVNCAEAFGPPPTGALIGPEVAHIQGRSPRRQRQFTAARVLARSALAELDVPARPLLPGRGGAPGWPDGTTGSITHCDGYTACAATRTIRYAALGIDAEPQQPLPHGTLHLTASAAEHRRLARLPQGTVPWDRLLFSAKEATYKAFYPLTHTWTALASITVTLRLDGTFTARHPLNPQPRQGRWTTRQGILVTALVLPPNSRQT